MIGGKVSYMSVDQSKWGIDMKVGDLVLFANDPTIGVIVEIRSNGSELDCCVLFNGEIYLCVAHSLEVINECR